MVLWIKKKISINWIIDLNYSSDWMYLHPGKTQTVEN
jgi:hypothetical protein